MDRALPMAGEAVHAETLHASPAFGVDGGPSAVRHALPDFVVL
jgi:hypothetical protein